MSSSGCFKYPKKRTLKAIGLPSQPHVKLSKKDCPIHDAAACSSFMYAMDVTRLDIARGTGVDSRLMGNPGKAQRKP